MKQHLAHIAIVVNDYDEAIAFYTQKLHFELIEDTILSETKRWVKVKPKGGKECSLLLAKAATEEQKSRVGNQTGGRVFLFLYTDNFKRDYQNLIDMNIKIVREPSHEEYGTVAVFEDLYGNLWDLIEPIKQTNYQIPHSEIPQYAQASLQPVEHTYKKVLYTNWLIAYTILITVLVSLFIFIKSLQINWLIGLVSIVLLLLISITIAAVEIGFKNRAWALREKDIQFRKGWLFQSIHIIPFNKVQHCEIVSGPIGRKYGLASIRINTAASNNIDISIKGLKQETAEQLKAFIMEKIEAYEHQQI